MANGDQSRNLDPTHHGTPQNCGVLEDEETRWWFRDVCARSLRVIPWASRELKGRHDRLEASLSRTTHRLHFQELWCAAFSGQKLPWRIDLQHGVVHWTFSWSHYWPSLSSLWNYLQPRGWRPARYSSILTSLLQGPGCSLESMRTIIVYNFGTKL